MRNFKYKKHEIVLPISLFPNKVDSLCNKSRWKTTFNTMIIQNVYIEITNVIECLSKPQDNFQQDIGVFTLSLWRILMAYEVVQTDLYYGQKVEY